MTTEELLQRYAAGERNFIEIDLSGANLSGAVLPEIDFCKCNLRDINFFRANLSGRSLIGSDLTGADLSNSNLAMVAMQGTILEGATLRGANTVDTAFAGAFFLNTIAWEGNVIEGPEYFD